MRRQFILVGLVLFLLLLLASISATIAAPQSAPLLQTSETEPNNSPSEADSITTNTQVTGNITQTGTTVDTDYFSLTTGGGIRYNADLTILSSPGMKLQIQIRDENEALLGTSSSSDSFVQLTWDSPGGVNYIQIRKQDVPTATWVTGYQLEVSLWSATATPQPPDAWDEYEPNDDFTEVYTLPVATSISLGSHDGDANFSPYDTRPGPDDDWFAFYVQSGQEYEAYTSDLSDSDTYLEVYRRNNSADPLVTNDNGGGGFSSQVEWQAAYTGYYYLHVVNNISTEGSYDLTIAQISPTPTSTPGPSPTPTTGPTPIPGADQYEPNPDFNSATIIATDVTYNLNLIPWGGFGPDNDFFKLWVKPGIFFTCETLDLDPGVDTNMIMFNGPSWDNAVGGNDDKDPLDYGSLLSYYSTYEGWLYVLVGTGDRQPPPGQGQSDYKLSCERGLPGVPTLTPSPRPSSTPRPSTTSTSSASPLPSPTITATPSPSGDLAVRPLTTPTPPPTPSEPSLHFVPVDLLVYYDANDDRDPGAGEGVAGILVLAFDTATGEQIAQGFTDELGHLQFTAAAEGSVRLSIPFLGVGQLIGSEGASAHIRIAPQPLPNLVP